MDEDLADLGAVGSVGIVRPDEQGAADDAAGVVERDERGDGSIGDLVRALDPPAGGRGGIDAGQEIDRRAAVDGIDQQVRETGDRRFIAGRVQSLDGERAGGGLARIGRGPGHRGDLTTDSLILRVPRPYRRRSGPDQDTSGRARSPLSVGDMESRRRSVRYRARWPGTKTLSRTAGRIGQWRFAGAAKAARRRQGRGRSRSRGASAAELTAGTLTPRGRGARRIRGSGSSAGVPGRRVRSPRARVDRDRSAATSSSSPSPRTAVPCAVPPDASSRPG